MEFNINIRADIHYHGDVAVVKEIRDKLEKIMTSLQDVLDAVTAESTKVDGIVALVASIKQQLADALSGTTLPPAVQAKVDAVFAGLTANATKLDTALQANVP
jgi:capsule polysaccharide export protein KpsE/RkpR